MEVKRDKEFLVKYLNHIYVKSRKMEFSELCDYFNKNLDLSLVDFHYMIFLGDKYFNDNSKEKLNSLLNKLIDYKFGEGVNISKKGGGNDKCVKYYEKNIALINGLLELSKRDDLQGDELLRYFRDKLHYNPSKLKLRIDKFIKYSIVSKQEIIDLMMLYANLKEAVYNERPEIKPNKEKLFESSTIVEDFIESGMSIFRYCIERYMRKDDFSYALRTVKRYNTDLYNLYLNYCTLREEYVKEEVFSKKDEMVEKIQNGVLLENGEKREFDILDYYSLMRSMDIIEFYKIYRKYSNDDNENKIIAKFCRIDWKGEQTYRVKTIKALMKAEIEFDGYKVDDDAKVAILDYLYSREIPISQRTFRTAVRRYFTNTLYDLYDYGTNAKSMIR